MMPQAQRGAQSLGVDGVEGAVSDHCFGEVVCGAVVHEEAFPEEFPGRAYGLDAHRAVLLGQECSAKVEGSVAAYVVHVVAEAVRRPESLAQFRRGRDGYGT